jgi:exosortase C (VPDSG-CTERM-specific)
MHSLTTTTAVPAKGGFDRPAAPVLLDAGVRRRLRCFALVAGLITLCFCKPLIDLARLSLRNDLFSHALLVPLVSLYLAWLSRGVLARPSGRSVGLAVVGAVAGLGALAGFWHAPAPGGGLHPEDTLCWAILSYLCFLMAGAACLLGKEPVKALWFPAAFLVFMVPMPTGVVHALEGFLQRGSAEGAHWLFLVAGPPVHRSGLIFQLPTITLQVAHECSGFRSTYVLFMTCLVAAYFFLRRPGPRLALVLAVVPLGLARNALRIFIIGALCVRFGPQMINSPLHRRGGPLFFILSLLPLFLLLFWLRRTETTRAASRDAGAKAVPPDGLSPAESVVASFQSKPVARQHHL